MGMKAFISSATVTVAMIFLISGAASADQQKITLGYTAIGDCAAAFAAKEQGYFAKRGLDVDLQLVNNSGILATDVASNAMEVGCDVPPVLLQAVDRGLDLVAVSGGSVSTPALTQEAVVIKTGLPIKTAHDFYGKKVGVGGIGSSGYVMFSAWLIKQHLDPKNVNFFEVPFSTQYDLLQRGTVDAVVSSDPMLAKITNDKTGTTFMNLTAQMPADTPIVIYIATQAWRSKNPAAAAAVRDALAEGAKFVTNNPKIAQQYIAQYLKQPLSVVQETQLSPLKPVLTEKQMHWWLDQMQKQGFVHSSIALSKVIAK
jgi:NitT/TauT family transport system substrate-binding protein